MYERDRISRNKVETRHTCECWVCRALKWGWIMTLLVALCLAINILKVWAR